MIIMTYSVMIPAYDEETARQELMKAFPDATITKVTPTKILYGGLPMWWVSFKSKRAKEWT
jgi:hypothetical protein